MYETTGMRQVGNLWELADDLHGSPYYNDDLAPTTTAQRTWNTWHIASLWIGMAVCIPTYMLAAGLISKGMNWWQAIGTVFLGNLIVLVPMCLNAHAGTKYGIPFPVLLRAPFGVFGSNVAALMRAFVACFWFGIQTWIGGSAIYALACLFFPEWGTAKHLTFFVDMPPMTWRSVGVTLDVGMNVFQALCFLLFWLVNVFVVVRGMDSIKWMESLAAPLLIGVGIALLVWGQKNEGLPKALHRSREFQGATVKINDGAEKTASRDVTVSLRPVRDGDQWRAREYRIAASAERLESAAWAPMPLLEDAKVDYRIPTSVGLRETCAIAVQFRGDKNAVSSVRQASILFDPDGGRAGGSQGGSIFWLGLTAMIAFWATLSLNIPDFTRFAKSQKAQISGQFLGLPTTMAFYSFVGIAATCAAVGIFHDILVVEDAPWNPVNLLTRFHQPWMIGISMFALMIATLTTNVAANIVSPANDFSNCAPNKIGFKMGAMIAAVLGILIMPWKLMEAPDRYLGFLVGYSSLLGPIGGIMIADYYIVRRARLRLPDLYKRHGFYRYCGGTSLMALFVLAVSILPNLPGFLVTTWPGTRPSLENLLRNIAWAFNARAFDASAALGSIVGLYQFAWFTGFGIALVLYSLFGLIVRKV